MDLELQNLDVILQEQRLERAPDWDQGAFFNFWVSEQILKNSGASVDDLMSAIVDGGNDCGVDAITFLIDDIPAAHYPDLTVLPSNCKVEMVIVQAKHGKSFQERPLLEMAASLPQLLDSARDEDALSLWCNPQLQQRTGEFLEALPILLPKFPRFAARIYYAARGDELHPKVAQRGRDLERALVTSGRFQHAEVVFLGASDLLKYARQQNRTVFTIKCATQPMASPDGNGYVGLVRLPDYRSFVCSDDGERLNTQLFDSNVRDHEGRNEVNDAIQCTLGSVDNSDDFWWLNNGVTVVATKALPNGHELILESPQVVNGLQTSTEVWLSPLPADDVRLILVRVIKATEAGVRDRIIQATNYQTAIPKSALRATDPKQRSLEEWLLRHDIYYDRRRNYYANQSYPIEQIVSMTRMAEAVASCYLQEPHMARSRGYQLMSMDEYYTRVFHSDAPEFYLNCLMIVRTAKSAVTDYSGINPFYAEDWFHLLSCAATILLTRKERPSPEDIGRLNSASFSSVRLADLLPLVRKHLAGSRQSTLPLKKQAESRDVTLRLVEDAKGLLRNSRWYSWPSSQVVDDFLAPTARLDPRRRTGS